jgi:paraquat-inducible protein B
MSRQANKTAIGAFVVGAAVLAVIAVIVFGSGWIFTERPIFVMYFEGSVKGLSIGSPVMFRGVNVGRVKSISIKADPKDLMLRIPVLVEINPDAVDTEEEFEVDAERELERLIDHGLRAKLDMQSLVTGLLQIEVGFFPDEKPRLVGGSRYPEIPTIPSTFERITRTVESIPIEEMVKKISSALTGIDRMINSPEVFESIKNLNQTIQDARLLVKNLDQRTGALAMEASDTLKGAQSLVSSMEGRIEPISSEAVIALREAGLAMEKLRETFTLESGIQHEMIVSINEMADSIKKTADAARPAITVGRDALANIGKLTGEDSVSNYQISSLLKELSAAARAIRIWAEYLERHPEALIRGKGGR